MFFKYEYLKYEYHIKYQTQSRPCWFSTQPWCQYWLCKLSRVSREGTIYCNERAWGILEVNLGRPKKKWSGSIHRGSLRDQNAGWKETLYWLSCSSIDQALLPSGNGIYPGGSCCYGSPWEVTTCSSTKAKVEPSSGCQRIVDIEELKKYQLLTMEKWG